MRLKHLSMIAGAGTALMALQAVSGAMAQNLVNERAAMAVTPVRAEGVQLRRVSTTDSTQLAYEYQTGAGVARVSVDPTSLVNDIERARKRAPQKKASVKSAPALALAAPAVRASEIAQAEVTAEVAADVAAPAPDAAPVPREDRKVRVIPLYKTPQAD
jgi:hypothetical protein